MSVDMDRFRNDKSPAYASFSTQLSNEGSALQSSNDLLCVATGALRSLSEAEALAAFDEASANPSPAQRSAAESTPEIAGAIGDRLNLDSVSDEEDEEDSIMDDASDSVFYDEQPPYGLPVSTLPTGLCYDERMRYHAEVATINESNYHPEDPRRIFFIFKELCEAGLVEDSKSRKTLVRQPLFRIDAREATEEECCLIHTAKHYEFVKRTSGE